MILYRWQGQTPNFGDELNTVLWPALLPGFFDAEPGERFLGIGSVLDARHPEAARKLVAGSGYAGYEPKPRLGPDWTIHWVRGPRTAAALGLPHALGLGDPASLVPVVLPPEGLDRRMVGFMPHFESADRGAWQQSAAQAGIGFIDPRDKPLAVIRAIAGCRLLLTEAMHGAIVADALRVPWIAIRPRASIHRAKWQDWGDTLGLSVRFQPVAASSIAEWAAASRLCRRHPVRLWVSRHQPRLARTLPGWFVAQAARSLSQAAEAAPQLSSDAALQRAQERMLDRIGMLQRSTPSRRPVVGADAASGLPARGLPASHLPESRLPGPKESAYHLHPAG